MSTQYLDSLSFGHIKMKLPAEVTDDVYNETIFTAVYVLSSDLYVT